MPKLERATSDHSPRHRARTPPTTSSPNHSRSNLRCPVAWPACAAFCRRLCKLPRACSDSNITSRSNRCQCSVLLAPSAKRTGRSLSWSSGGGWSEQRKQKFKIVTNRNLKAVSARGYFSLPDFLFTTRRRERTAKRQTKQQHPTSTRAHHARHAHCSRSRPSSRELQARTLQGTGLLPCCALLGTTAHRHRLAARAHAQARASYKRSLSKAPGEDTTHHFQS